MKLIIESEIKLHEDEFVEETLQTLNVQYRIDEFITIIEQKCVLEEKNMNSLLYFIWMNEVNPNELQYVPNGTCCEITMCIKEKDENRC